MARVIPWILIAVAVLTLLVHLDADPSRLAWRDFITDEGWWTAEARDHALFGHWVTDDYNQGLAVPVATWIWRASFALGGVTLLAARAPSAVAALLTLLLLWLIARRERPRDAAIAPLLLATALPFAIHARLAMPEPLAVLGVTAAWWLLGGITRPGFRRPALAGLAFGLALSAKFSVVVAGPPLLWIALRLSAPRMAFPPGGGPVLAAPARERWFAPVNFAFAAALSWGVARLGFGLRHPAELSALEHLYRQENLPASPVDLLANLAYFPMPTPFLYQTAALLVLAGLGAWALGLNARSLSPSAQALTVLVMGGLTQAVFMNPADRRFVVFLPALALLAARGWRALADGEALPRRFVGRVDLAGLLVAAFALALVLPGRLALWTGRLRSVMGSPLPDERLRALAALLFVATMALALFWLGRRPLRAPAMLVTGLLLGWLVVCLEPFDALAWAGVFHALGRYDAGPVWASVGRYWAPAWGLVTLLLIWAGLGRAGLLPAGRLERRRALLPWLVPLVALALLAGERATPTFTLRDAGARLAAPLADGTACRALVGPEAATLGLTTRLPALVPRDAFNPDVLRNPPPNSRILTMTSDSGTPILSEWPAGADSLTICPDHEGRSRFVFAVEEHRSPRD
ncbi:glycosyltransferase family 39 protein [bacterium]|nr:glycosyltransferase family 39 protein [bacterium]